MKPVLGAKLEEGLEGTDYGQNTHIIPMVYQTVLRKAHQRTFNLQKRLLEAQPTLASDPEVEAVLIAEAKGDLFVDDLPKPKLTPLDPIFGIKPEAATPVKPPSDQGSESTVPCPDIQSTPSLQSRRSK